MTNQTNKNNDKNNKAPNIADKSRLYKNLSTLTIICYLMVLVFGCGEFQQKFPNNQSNNTKDHLENLKNKNNHHKQNHQSKSQNLDSFSQSDEIPNKSTFQVDKQTKNNYQTSNKIIASDGYLTDVDLLQKLNEKALKLKKFLKKDPDNQQILKAHMLMGMSTNDLSKVRFLKPRFVNDNSDVDTKDGLEYTIDLEFDQPGSFMIKPKIFANSNLPNEARRIIKCVESDGLTTEIIKFDPSLTDQNRTYKPDGQNTEYLFEQIESRTQLRDILNISTSLNASASIPIMDSLSLDASGKLINQSIFNENYKIYAIKIRMTNPAVTMSSPRLTQAAKKLIDTKNISKLYDLCGETFIYGYITGGSLVSILKLSLKKQYRNHKMTFDAALNATGFIFGASLQTNISKKQLSNSQKLNASFYTRSFGGHNIEVVHDIYTWQHQFNKWTDSVSKNAVVIEYITRPIKDLVELNFDQDYHLRVKALHKLNAKLDALMHMAWILNSEGTYRGYDQISDHSVDTLYSLIEEVKAQINLCKSTKDVKNPQDSSQSYQISNCFLPGEILRKIDDFDYEVEIVHPLCGYNQKLVKGRNSKCKKKETITVEKKDKKYCTPVYYSRKKYLEDKTFHFQGYEKYSKNSKPNLFRKDYSQDKFYDHNCEAGTLKHKIIDTKIISKELTEKSQRLLHPPISCHDLLPNDELADKKPIYQRFQFGSLNRSSTTHFIACYDRPDFFDLEYTIQAKDIVRFSCNKRLKSHGIERYDNCTENKLLYKSCEYLSDDKNNPKKCTLSINKIEAYKNRKKTSVSF